MIGSGRNCKYPPGDKRLNTSKLVSVPKAGNSLLTKLSYGVFTLLDLESRRKCVRGVKGEGEGGVEAGSSVWWL